MQHASDAQLYALPSAARVAVVRNLGGATLRKLARPDLQRLRNFALRNVRRAASSAGVDRSASSVLDELDLASLAALRCSLEEADMDRLSAKAIRKFMRHMGRCAWSRSQRKRLLRRAKVVFR